MADKKGYWPKAKPESTKSAEGQAAMAAEKTQPSEEYEQVEARRQAALATINANAALVDQGAGQGLGPGDGMEQVEAVMGLTTPTESVSEIVEDVAEGFKSVGAVWSDASNYQAPTLDKIGKVTGGSEQLV